MATDHVADADVVVIGAGICGVAGAIALQRRGLRVEVLERGTLGAGASGRNAGFLMRGAAENYAAAIRIYGREVARLIWRWTQDNLSDLRHEGIRKLPSYRDVPSCLLALEPGELSELRESLELLRADGFPVEWADRGEDSAWRSSVLPPLGGLINPGDAAVNPAEMMAFLAQKLQRPVRTGCEVAEIGASEGGLRASTSLGAFGCRHVLVCTNAYAGLLLPCLDGIVVPRRGQMLALRQDGMRLDCSYYANHGYEYFRQTTDGTIVVGGCRKRYAQTEVGVADHPTGEVQSSLEAFACAMLGLERADLNIVARWAGIMGFSPDGLPLVGPVPGNWPAGAVWFCGGFTGHGMSMAWRTAHAAVAAMLERAPNPFSMARLHESRAGAGDAGPAAPRR